MRGRRILGAPTLLERRQLERMVVAHLLLAHLSREHAPVEVADVHAVAVPDDHGQHGQEGLPGVGGKGGGNELAGKEPRGRDGVPEGEAGGDQLAHQLDQFIRVEEGEGKSVLDGVERDLTDGSAVIIPAGTHHNIINTSTSDALKLYTVYAPPNHKDGTVHVTKADAEGDEEHFDGVTTETL